MVLSYISFPFHTLGNEVPIINIIARNSRLPTNEGYISFSNYLNINILVDVLCMHRERVESLILSSQISTDPQRRVFLEGETITLTFNLGQVYKPHSM